MLSDSKVIRRVRNGRTQDFCVLVERYQKSVYALAYRILGNRDDAEDATQDTFIKVFQNLHSYSESKPFWPWLRRIAINCCMDRLPYEFPSDEVDEMRDAEQIFANPVEAEVLARHDKDKINAIIEGLPAEYRVAVVLRYHDGLSTPEIAEILDQPVGTVRVRLHRAIKMLSERMAVVRDEL